MSIDNNIEQMHAVALPAKKKFSFERYVQQLQQMDMNNIGSWPLSVKCTLYVFILVLIGVAGYLVVIRDVHTKISDAEAQQQNLLNEFRDKDSKLRNLQQYEAQVRLMEAQFELQLEQLPKETEIAGLVEDISTAASSSGLELKNIKLVQELKQEVFIEQPIDIIVVGNYHSMGSLVSAIATLPRIVTLHDFSLKSEVVKGSEMPKQSMSLKAKTYRYITEKDKNTKK